VTSRWQPSNALLAALAALAAALLASATLAHAGTVVVREANFREELSDEVAVSGEVRVGVLAGAQSGPAGTDPLKLWVDLPPGEARTICVKLTSRDGRYRAEGSAELTAEHVGKTDVKLTTHHVAGLRGKPAKPGDVHLAPLVTLSPDASCRGRMHAIAPASWTEGPPGNELTVLVNSGGLATRLVYWSLEGRTEVACTAIDAPQLVAFDTTCVVALPPTARNVTIERQEFGDLVRVPLPLAAPTAKGR
jgi:hypothetical protein